MSVGKQSSHMPVEILIVDDSPTQLQLLGHHLEQAGYRVNAASDGHKALEAAERGHAALVITDVNMPEMNGYELCRRLKNHPTL